MDFDVLILIIFDPLGIEVTDYVINPSNNMIQCISTLNTYSTNYWKRGRTFYRPMDLLGRFATGKLDNLWTEKLLKYTKDYSTASHHQFSFIHSGINHQNMGVLLQSLSIINHISILILFLSPLVPTTRFKYIFYQDNNNIYA